jgi:hypothetical protein
VKTANVSIFVGVIVCGLIAGHAPLHAQAVDDPNMAGGEDMPWNKGVPQETRTAARTVFLEGNRLFKIPLFSQAVEKYTEAISKWRHPAFYFNLAVAEINLSQYLEARENLEEALRYGPDPLRADRYQEAKKQLVEVERHLGRIRVSCPTPDAEVTLDGVTLFTGPGSQEVWVKANAHEITAKKQGYLAEAKRVMVSPGALQDVALKLVTLSEAADTGRRWAVWKPWAVVATGAAVMISAGVLHTLSARNFSDYDKQFQQLSCATTTGCRPGAIPPALSDQLNRATREQQLAVGGYIAGGSVIATGVVLLYLNRPGLIEQHPMTIATRDLVVVPVVSADMLGILVSVYH